MNPAHPEHLSDQARREIADRDWDRMHIEADKRAPVRLFGRRWSYSGAGTRRERGGFGR